LPVRAAQTAMTVPLFAIVRRPAQIRSQEALEVSSRGPTSP